MITPILALLSLSSINCQQFGLDNFECLQESRCYDDEGKSRKIQFGGIQDIRSFSNLIQYTEGYWGTTNSENEVESFLSLKYFCINSPNSGSISTSISATPQGYRDAKNACPPCSVFQVNGNIALSISHKIAQKYLRKESIETISAYEKIKAIDWQKKIPSQLASLVFTLETHAPPNPTHLERRLKEPKFVETCLYEVYTKILRYNPASSEGKFWLLKFARKYKSFGKDRVFCDSLQSHIKKQSH